MLPKKKRKERNCLPNELTLNIYFLIVMLLFYSLEKTEGLVQLSGSFMHHLKSSIYDFLSLRLLKCFHFFSGRNCRFKAIFFRLINFIIMYLCAKPYCHNFNGNPNLFANVYLSTLNNTMKQHYQKRL